jgi:hypothetical protein
MCARGGVGQAACAAFSRKEKDSRPDTRTNQERRREWRTAHDTARAQHFGPIARGMGTHAPARAGGGGGGVETARRPAIRHGTRGGHPAKRAQAPLARACARPRRRPQACTFTPNTTHLALHHRVAGLKVLLDLVQLRTHQAQLVQQLGRGVPALRQPPPLVPAGFCHRPPPTKRVRGRAQGHKHSVHRRRQRTPPQAPQKYTTVHRAPAAHTCRTRDNQRRRRPYQRHPNLQRTTRGHTHAGHTHTHRAGRLTLRRP